MATLSKGLFLQTRQESKGTTLKSPIKAKPLRNPGESLEQQLNDALYNDVLTYALWAMFVVILAGFEWWRWYKSILPNPIVVSVSAVIVVAFSAWKVRYSIKHIKRLKLGLQGEKAVGQFLDDLRETGAKIFHDIPGSNFNLDHVVVSTTGVFVIETKTLSKPDRGEAKLIYNGETVSKHGLEPERNPIIQVRAATKWLGELLKESTGRSFPMRAVVVYPGWYIQPTAEAKTSDVWVLNPKALPTFISNSRSAISPEDVNLCAYHLKRLVRTSEC
jgi:hypothetical protein